MPILNLDLKLLGHWYDLAIKVFLYGVRELEPDYAGLNLIYMLCQPIISLDNDQSIVGTLTSDAPLEEYLVLLHERVCSLGLTLVPLECDFLFSVRPLLAFPGLNKSVDSI